MADDNAKEATRQTGIALLKEAEANRQREVAEQNARIAERNARLARSRVLTVYADQSLNEDPERSILLAAEALRATVDHGEPPLAAAEQALHQALNSSRLSAVLLQGGPVAAVAWSPDGKRLATAGTDGVLKIWNAATLKLSWQVWRRKRP